METCEHKNERGIFCANCGEKLKEKCSDCGQMERINRKVCEKKIDEAVVDWDKYSEPIKKKRSIRIVIASISVLVVLAILCVLFVFLVVVVCKYSYIEPTWALFIVIVFPTVITTYCHIFVLEKIDASKEKAIKKARCMFCEEFPEQNEVLKKADYFK